MYIIYAEITISATGHSSHSSHCLDSPRAIIEICMAWVLVYTEHFTSAPLTVHTGGMFDFTGKGQVGHLFYIVMPVSGTCVERVIAIS